jgi:hypothetical protein
VVFPPTDDADCKLVVPTILGHSVFDFYSARIKVHCHRLATSNAKIRLAKRDTVSECCSAHFCSLGLIPFFQSIVAMGWAIALHGGAGDISKDLPTARREAVEACLSHCLRLGVSALQSSHTALDVAELVVTFFPFSDSHVIWILRAILGRNIISFLQRGSKLLQGAALLQLVS